MAVTTDTRPLAPGRFARFQDLAQHRVENILLVCSLYDSFILAEDGQLGELILGEFLDLSLRHSPGITRVSSGAEALALAPRRAPIQPHHHLDARRRHGRPRRWRAGCARPASTSRWSCSPTTAAS